MEMKKCKECGKLFVPKSARSQYCDDLHYRPCPVCGKPVEAKYLSDPPRCCSKECQQASRAKNRPSVSPSITPIVDKVDITSDSGLIHVNVLSDIVSHNIKRDISEEGKQLKENGQARTFLGASCCGFTSGHTYLVELNRDIGYSTYQVSAYYDLTEDKSVDLEIAIASMISFNQFFAPISKKIVLGGQ